MLDYECSIKVQLHVALHLRQAAAIGGCIPRGRSHVGH